MTTTTTTTSTGTITVTSTNATQGEGGGGGIGGSGGTSTNNNDDDEDDDDDEEEPLRLTREEFLTVVRNNLKGLADLLRREWEVALRVRIQLLLLLLSSATSHNLIYPYLLRPERIITTTCFNDHHTNKNGETKTLPINFLKKNSFNCIYLTRNELN